MSDNRLIATADDGRQVVILTPDELGGLDASFYDFGEIKIDSTLPQKPVFNETLAELNLNTWNGILDAASEQDYNTNIRAVQGTVNSLVSINRKLINFIDGLSTQDDVNQDYFKKLAAAYVAKYMSDNCYSKAEVDALSQSQEKEIKDLRDEVHQLHVLLTRGRNYSHFVAPNITPPKQINETVQENDNGDHIEDDAVKKKLNEINGGEPNGQ